LWIKIVKLAMMFASDGGKHLANENTNLYTIKDGIIVVKKGVVLPDGFSIG
jgi:glucose-1-phosphate adenylyltransferase